MFALSRILAGDGAKPDSGDGTKPVFSVSLQGGPRGGGLRHRGGRRRFSVPTWTSSTTHAATYVIRLSRWWKARPRNSSSFIITTWDIGIIVGFGFVYPLNTRPSLRVQHMPELRRRVPIHALELRLQPILMPLDRHKSGLGAGDPCRVHA